MEVRRGFWRGKEKGKAVGFKEERKGMEEELGQPGIEAGAARAGLAAASSVARRCRLLCLSCLEKDENLREIQKGVIPLLN